MKIAHIIIAAILAFAFIAIYMTTNTSTDETDYSEACKYNRGEYEFRVYDSQGRMTGVKNGEEKLDIPDSFYFDSYKVELEDEENTTFWMPAQVILYDLDETYTFELFGTKEGNYRLNNKYTIEKEELKFNASNIPLAVGETHQYHYDWEALKDGKKGIILLIDKDNDGIFEKELHSDSNLTCEEYLKEMES